MFRRSPGSLQRFLAAPLVAAGGVAACGLAAAFHGFLRAGPAAVIGLLGGACLLGAFAGGLVGPRPARPGVGTIALSASLTAGLLLHRVSAATGAFPRWIAPGVAVLLLPAAAALAALGVAARRFLSRD